MKNPEDSSSTPIASNGVMQRNLKRLITLNSIILLACSIALFGRIYTNTVNARNHRKHDKWSYFVFEIIVMLLGIFNAVFGLILAIYEHKQHSDQQLNKCNRWNFTHLLINLICSFLFSLFFVIEFIRWFSGLLNDDQVSNGIRIAVILLALIIALCQTVCAIDNRILAWSPKYRYSRFVLCFSSIILMAISIASIHFNTRVRYQVNNVTKSRNVLPWCYRIFQASSSYTLICGLVGFCLTFVYGRTRNGPNQFRKRLRYSFNIFCTIGLLLVVIFTIILLFSDTKIVNRTKLPNVHTLTHSNLVISTIQCVLLIFVMISLYNLIRATRPGRNGLTVERIRLNETSPTHVTYWATAIDAFDCIPDGMTGDAALQLMKAYENGHLENIECVVLRIGRSDRRVALPNNQWDDTEALVLLTIIHNYDAISVANLNGMWSRILKRTLGSENCTKRFRPLLLRLGLIGYQWPFRTSIFFTASHPDPLIRAAHVLKIIIDWNEMQKSRLHCDVLLLPTFSTEVIAKAIPTAGFFPLPLPPTHLLDLRPHHGKTWNEYMKTLKKGNRRPYIQQFLTKGGTIEEVHDLNVPEVGETVCKQWENIARIRHDNKEPSTFTKPSVEFISSMGNHMNEAYRSVVFLRFNNEVIASSVIYKFPSKLLTTDIQGLTHEKARPLKAYFVMSQWVIKEALNQKYDFVDFGPTTPGPKIDLGCVPVPLEAGGYAGNPILAFGIQKAGSNVNNIHDKKDNQQQQGTSNQVEKEHDTQPPTGNNIPSRHTLSNNHTTVNTSKKQFKNAEKLEMPEDSTVTIDNEIQSTVHSSNKVNLSNNKSEPTLNGRNQTRRKNKQVKNVPKENQPVDPIKSSDIAIESNDLTVNETFQSQRDTDESISTDVVISIFPPTSTTEDCIVHKSELDFLPEDNERLDFV